MFEALRDFAAAVTEKTTQLTRGEPEEQLRAPFEGFLQAAAGDLGESNVVCTGETRLPDRLGCPDFAVHKDGLLVGYAEIKAPGAGADATRFKGRNRSQFKRFAAIPNLLYSDGNEWALYRGGERVGKIARLSGDVANDGAKAVKAEDARALEPLLRDFLSWAPVLPLDREGKIDFKALAAVLAPLCRLLRDDVVEAVKDERSPLVALAKDWRQLLFPGASDEQFADAYAQTVTFALLLARSEGAEPLALERAVEALAAQHSLLSRALQVLTDLSGRKEITASLNLLLRVISVVPITELSGSQDPWLYFYEDFLAAYDPELRKNAGAYYTPVEVVHAQVRLADELLGRLGKPWGFASHDVVTLDPASGTGTYLLGVIEHALKRIEIEQGPGAVPPKAVELAKNLHGFELMTGPYAVSELRVSRALQDRSAGAGVPCVPRIYLTDTLESPHAEPPQTAMFMQPISEQHSKALKVKKETPVIVCLGNPPYDRHEAAASDNKARTGSWVRWGDNGNGEKAIFSDFLDPLRKAGGGLHAKNLYNLYVYFWRWALWKVFEHDAPDNGGVVSFISASSYLDGKAFVGMREHMRRVCDEIWILDLGGEGRGPRKSDNVFDIQTPVTIAVAYRQDRARRDKPDEPAKVHYARIEGTRSEKLAKLDAIKGFKKVKWRDCPNEWQAPFHPAGKGKYFNWPLLTELMPWQHSGVQFKRTWPIAPDADTLERRWRGLLRAENRAQAFRETRDQQINRSYHSSLLGKGDATPIANLPDNAPMPETRRYAYRIFERQHIIADARLIERPRLALWRAHSEQQVYLTSPLTKPLGAGPALGACALVPDVDYFPGSGGKSVIPLYRNADATEANIAAKVLAILGRAFKRTVTPEDFAAYIYGALAHPAFTQRFWKELETRELRVPIAKDAALFEEIRKIGARLLWLHTYGERCIPAGEQPGQIPRGRASCAKAVPSAPDSYPSAFRYDAAGQTLHVGAGEFASVSPEVYDFRISGHSPVQFYIKRRLRNGGGRKSSPLDDIRPKSWTAHFTEELLQLLWLLESALDAYPRQAELLDAVLKEGCLSAKKLLPTTKSGRPSQGFSDNAGADPQVAEPRSFHYAQHTLSLFPATPAP